MVGKIVHTTFNSTEFNVGISCIYFSGIQCIFVKLWAHTRVCFYADGMVVGAGERI